MSSLIITLIGIALVAVTAVIALFTLGDTFMSGGDKADFARLQNEANQIVVATNLYMAQNNGASPANVSELVQQDYLKNEFRGLTDFVELNGESVQVEWEFGFDNFVTQLIDSNERCARINETAGGSGNVEDIPSCSAPHDHNNPCCTF